MKAMTNEALLSAMKNDHVEIDPVTKGEDVYSFKIDNHQFGHLDKYGNLYMDTFEEVISRPLSLGKKTITRWINWAVKGFRINRRRIEKWQ
ncbi:hypothetical protein [Limosilactobacillus avium]|uniref:hypothetical protein n=1 Tax=Limosilactobacillus avium TaxID=2991831 RepID=UPI0024B8E58F|nr:hypothetical protein [Limosilactobacillus avium]